MLRYVVTRFLRIPYGVVLALSSTQAVPRAYGLQALKQTGWFKTTTKLCFKAGETLGFEKEPPVPLLRDLQVIVVEEGFEAAGFCHSPAAQLVTPPPGLSTLEQIAYQTILKEGYLTLKRYQQLCRGVPRRSLQRILTRLVKKHYLIRKGFTHQLRYYLSEGEQACT
jgi:hypothetical protein